MLLSNLMDDLSNRGGLIEREEANELYAEIQKFARKRVNKVFNNAGKLEEYEEDLDSVSMYLKDLNRMKVHNLEDSYELGGAIGILLYAENILESEINNLKEKYRR